MMKRQMELFEDGGLKDEGGMVDKESGNKVPTGSTREEVRDDIPAKLSEGEFVMPADVVRYHGLDKMMDIRDEAKMGLQKMEAMGQMGNSDEATLPDDMPFGMSDLIIVAGDGREVEMAEGGYVTMAKGGATRQLGPTYTPPVSQPLDFTTVMGEGKISYKEYRNAEGKNILVAFIGGVPLYPIPEGYTEYTPGENEPITPIQEVVQESPPTPVADDEDNQRAGYETGYSIGYENMTPEQLLRESKRMNSVFGKIAFGIPMLINPIVGAAAYGALGDKYPQLDAEINKRLKTDPKNKFLIDAQKLSKDNKQGKLAGETVTTIKKFAGDKITQFFGENTLAKVIELSGAKTNTPKNVDTVAKQVTESYDASFPREPAVRAVPSTTDSAATTPFVSNMRDRNMRPPGMTPQTDLNTTGVMFADDPVIGYDFASVQPEDSVVGLRQQDVNARLNLRPVEMDQSPARGADTTLPQAVLDDQMRDVIRGASGNVDVANQQEGIIQRREDRKFVPDGSSIGQFLGGRSGGTGGTVNQYTDREAIERSREIADGPGFIETLSNSVEALRDKNRAAALQRSEARRAEREANLARDPDFYNAGPPLIGEDGTVVNTTEFKKDVQNVKDSLYRQPERNPLNDAAAAALGYLYDGTVNGYVGKGAKAANDYLLSLPGAIIDLLSLSIRPAGAATMDANINKIMTQEEADFISNSLDQSGATSAIIDSFNKAQQARADGTLPSGVQVASAGAFTNEQLRQLGQGYMTAGDRYAMGYGGRGLQGTRPEGFGSQDLGYTPPVRPPFTDAPVREGDFRLPADPNMRDRNMRTPGMVDPRDPNMRDRNMRTPGMIPSDDLYIASQRDRNMRTPGMVDLRDPDSFDPRGPSQIPDSRRPFPTPQLDAVAGPFAPNVGGTSGRLQDFRGGDPFKPLRGAGIGGSNMGTPDNVTDISTRERAQLTGPTPANYGTQDFNAFGEGVSPPLRQGDIIPYSPNMRDRNITTPGMTAPTNLELKDPFNRFEGPKQEEILRQAQILKDRGIGAVPTSPLVGGSSIEPLSFSPVDQFGVGDPRGRGATDFSRQLERNPMTSATQTPGFLDAGGRMPQRVATDVPGFLDSGGQMNIADPRGRDQIPDSRRPFIGAGTDPYAGINEVNLQPEGPRPSVDDATRMMDINEPEADTSSYRDDVRFGQQAAQFLQDNIVPSGVMPSFQNKYPTSPVPYERMLDSMQDFSNRSTNVYPQLEGVSPRTRATVSDSTLDLDSGMGAADAPSMDMSFDPTRQPYDASFPREPAVPALSTTQSALAPNYMVEAGRTGDPKLTDAQTKQSINRVTSQRRELDYKDRQQEVISKSAGNSTLLRSGRVVPKNSPMDVYNNEQEETGYIGTDAEGYGVGMIAGPDQAGVVVDESGKARKTDNGMTIYQDSKGQQYTKSTFGKRETLDGKKYTPAEGAKKGDGADRDNDGEADEAKIICTAMNASYGFGSYRQAIWLNYSNKHLTKAHEVGYHTLFLPLVHLAYTKNNKLIRKILEHGTRRRTADLRAELKGTKRNTLGRFYRSIFEPLCYGVGKIKMAFGE